ncbi:MAG TPA: NAD-dependent epimerase/dehydratase family protein [Terriglobales bacterium]|nr:NAD-dependent epimerase/dehydratase family protein [Terriglobales bacterium]
MKSTLVCANAVIQEDVESIVRGMKDVFAPLSGRTVLITGGSGFLCSYLLECLAVLNDTGWYKPCRTISIDNLRSGVGERVAHLGQRPDFRFLSHDVSQPLELGEPVDFIVHGAGIASPTFYRQFPLETVDVNVSGTRHMLDLALRDRAQSILYMSTSEIYGDPEAKAIPTPEDYRGFVSCTGPRACYDESKRLAETLCSIYYAKHGAPVKVMRPFNVYGPGQRLDDRRIVPDLMSAAIERRPIVLYSDGRATRSFCYVSDAIRAMWFVLLSDANGEAFNVGSDEREITIGELARELVTVAGPPQLEIVYKTSQDAQYLTDNPQRRCPDLRKLKGRFDWKPQVTLVEGLGRTLRSYME